MARQGAVYDDEKSKNDLDELENKYAAQSADDSDLPEGHPSRSDSLKKREEDTDSVETKADRGERSFYKAEDNDDDSSDDAGSHKFSLRGRLNKRNGTIISAILLLGTGGVLLNSILSGPLQLLQLGKIIELAHFSDNNEFSNNRSARRMYNLLKGKPQNSNLGRVNNVIADRLEIKLNNRSGLKSTYHPTTGRFVGFEVLDEVKARDRIADLTSEKPDVLTERNGKKFINLEGLNFRERRAAIRTFVRGADIDGVAGRLSSRLLIKRAGVDFHPLKGIRRKATDKLVQFYADRKKERVERVREGTADVDINAPNSDKPTDANGDPIPNPDGDEAANAAREIIGDADVDLDSPEAIKSLKTKLLAKLGGAAAAVGAACTLRGLGEEAEKLQYAQTILPMVRTGMMYASVASQIQAGDVNLDELGALQAELFDESDDGDDTTKPSSVFSAQPFQAFRGEELNGPDISPHLKPGKIDEKPFFFRLIDGIPGIDEACSVSDFISGIPVIKQIGQLTGAVIGTFIPIDKFVDGIIGWLAGKGMDYYANGGPLGAIIMYGARLGANNQAAATGGLEISGTESAALRLYNQDSVNYDFNRQGRVAKIFDAEDPRSVVAQLAMARPRTPADMLAAIISSPLKIVSSLMPSAHAATPYDYGFNQVGFSVEEMNDPAISDPYLNAEEVEPQLPALNEKYGKKML